MASDRLGPDTGHSPLITIRRPVPSDVEFMLKTWLREQRRAVSSACPDRLYYNEFQKVILALTRKSDARVLCAAGDPNFIAGFVVGSAHPEFKTFVIHFAYMRPPFRRYGLCREAMKDMGWKPDFEVVATHWGPYLKRFDHLALNLIYNPYSLYKVE